MFPGLGGRGMNPRKVKQMMKQMGINIEEIENIEQVIIRCTDKEIVFDDAEISIMDAQGSKTYQLTGTPVERPRAVVDSNEDIQLVVDQTGVTPDAAAAALKEVDGDLVEAISKLSA